MTTEFEAGILLALRDDGFMTDRDIVAWADRKISGTEGPKIPSWLMELSLRGPTECRHDPRIELPKTAELTFVDRFAVRAASLDLGDESAVMRFAEWAARSAMGEDLEEPVVNLSYVLDHYLNDLENPVLVIDTVRAELPALHAGLRSIAARLVPRDAPDV